jgi:hypothetical protein
MKKILIDTNIYSFEMKDDPQIAEIAVSVFKPLNSI